MSEVKVNKISPRSGTDVALGDSGDTFTIPSGATLVNNGTATGFFEGIAWQSVVTAATLTAVAGNGYPINTTSNACTVTLPSSASTGDQIQIVDYAGTFATNNITLTSSLNIEGGGVDKILTTNREGVTITYVDVTQGWVATSGVNSGDQALDPIIYSADFLVIAGGGGGGGEPAGHQGGGGGAGGYRNSYSTETSGGGGSSETSLTFNAGTVYTITVGAGGVKQVAPNLNGVTGSNSSISGSNITTISSVGGGGGGVGQQSDPGASGASGGSGGGGANSQSSGGAAGGSGGSGTANQGFSGGSAFAYTSDPDLQSGGGGGAGAAGGNATATTAGSSGAGLASSITGSSVARAGGGVGGTFNNIAGTVNLAGTPASTAATANTGSGGGKNGDGGSGVVILRMPTANYSGTTTGSPTVSTDGTDTILVFNANGSYTA
jgi:hypothetical protein